MIHPTAVIYPNVTIEPDVYIGAYAVIGSPAEHKKYWGKPCEYGVIIKRGTIINGSCTIDAGTERDTVIGEDCFIMKGAYIAHDCNLGNKVTISANVSIGGGVVIESLSNIGMGASIHQSTRVAEGCMIGMNAVITKTTRTKPYSKYVGVPAKYLSKNERI